MQQALTEFGGHCAKLLCQVLVDLFPLLKEVSITLYAQRQKSDEHIQRWPN
jgi:hypothetical protein